jgi:hypothetical protein
VAGEIQWMSIKSTQSAKKDEKIVPVRLVGIH